MDSQAPLLALLKRMSDGDESAARAVYLEYAPYLKLVIRRKISRDLQGRFDSSDVVQSVWADLLDGFRKGRWTFESPDHFRAFLVRATKNRMIDYVRKHSRGVDQASWSESILPNAGPSPSSEARANEQWDRIVEHCPSEHRRIIEMKRDGHSLAEIATETGYHPSSVRRILYTLSDQWARQNG